MAPGKPNPMDWKSLGQRRPRGSIGNRVPARQGLVQTGIGRIDCASTCRGSKSLKKCTHGARLGVAENRLVRDR
jgi:hypothetical protein